MFALAWCDKGSSLPESGPKNERQHRGKRSGPSHGAYEFRATLSSQTAELAKPKAPAWIIKTLPRDRPQRPQTTRQPVSARELTVFRPCRDGYAFCCYVNDSVSRISLKTRAALLEDYWSWAILIVAGVIPPKRQPDHENGPKIREGPDFCS